MSKQQDKDDFMKALDSLAPEYKKSLNLSATYAPVFYGSGDVAFVPMSQALAFTQLAKVFADNKVFEEIALPTIAVALGSHRLPEKEHLAILSLWGGDREQAFVRVRNRHAAGEPLGNFSFLHPVKLGVLAEPNRSVLAEVYAEFFG